MSARFERALLLLRQSRPADAERELLLGLVEAPESALGHAYLALARVELDKKEAALESARAAVGLEPDTSFVHYVHALVLHRLQREKEALATVEEAIRLDPDHESYFALLASVHLALRDWPTALAAAERGLELSPEDVQCANFRSMALVRLGRKEEAMETVDFALRRAPESAFSHANQGWNCLHRNDPRRAQDHFREALRLDPDFEYARQGMLESLRARNPVYRLMLAYFLWMGRQSGRLQWAFVLGTFFGVRFVRTTAEENPALAVYLWPILILFYVFVYLSWTAGPMFNLLLRFDRFGRWVLSADERKATNWFGAGVAYALAGLGYWAWSGNFDGALFAIFGAVMSVCVAIVFSRTGGKRAGFATASVFMAVTGLIGSALILTGVETGYTYLTAVLVAFLAYQVAANFVR